MRMARQNTSTKINNRLTTFLLFFYYDYILHRETAFTNK